MKAAQALRAIDDAVVGSLRLSPSPARRPLACGRRTSVPVAHVSPSLRKPLVLRNNRRGRELGACSLDTESLSVYNVLCYEHLNLFATESQALLSHQHHLFRYPPSIIDVSMQVSRHLIYKTILTDQKRSRHDHTRVTCPGAKQARGRDEHAHHSLDTQHWRCNRQQWRKRLCSQLCTVPRCDRVACAGQRTRHQQRPPR